MSGDPSHRFLFYSGEASASSDIIVIAGDEHHHMTRVLRMSPGEMVYVTNGRGVIACCRIEEIDRRTARLRVVSVEEDRPRARPVTLALALLRKDAFERAVEQCTEIGITACLPFVSERSHLRIYSNAFVERLQRLSFAAAKQSFRSWIPDIERPVPFDELLSRAAKTPLVLVGDEAGEAAGALPNSGAVIVIVGPEGGLSERERHALAGSGARFVRVGPNRLRSETAAVALLSLAIAGDARTRKPGSDPIDRDLELPLD
jgi:16S rRNA (uracil1498-N3)-methyltransferase